MPTEAEAETFGGVTYHIDGELAPAPVLIVDVTRAPGYFEHHVLLCKHRTVRIGLKATDAGCSHLRRNLPERLQLSSTA